MPKQASYFHFISYHFNKFELEKIFIKSYINRLINLMEENVGVKFSEDKLLKRKSIFTF